MQGTVIHSDVVSPQRFFDVVQCVPDLRGEPLASDTINDVLILPLREFSASAKSLPKSEGWNVLCRFASHELF